MKCKLLILLVLLFLPVLALADTHTVENENLLLTIDDTTLYMTVTDKVTGKSFASSIEPASGKLTGWKAFVALLLTLFTMLMIIIAMVIAAALVAQLWEFITAVWKEARFYNEV